MKKLTRLHAALKGLRRRRRIVRLGTAFSALLVAALWVLAATFVVDWLFEMNRPQRVLALIACAVTVGWAFRKFSRPFMGRRETELDMALLIEKEQEIDSDLIAAIQFEHPEASKWGSRDLEEAVIDYVAEFGRELDVFKGLSYGRLARRCGLLCLTVLLLAGAAAIFPLHAKAFLSRLLLGSAHYPTRTTIEKIAVNGEDVGFPPRELRIPFGRPVAFEVSCVGQLPPKGTVSLTPAEGGEGTTVTLDLRPGAATYAGALPRLLGPAEYSVRVGDAWTDPGSIAVVPLPVVELELKPLPPAYARGEESEVVEGARQISVIEGSRVDLRLTCSNKRLEKATVTIAGKVVPFQREDGGSWSLDPRGTPLERVAEPVYYEVQVLDEDGLALESPLQGSIRIKVDKRPRVAAAMVTQHVLPSAKPVISYRATDDYGIARLVLQIQITQGGGASRTETRTVAEIPPASQPKTVADGRYAVDLRTLNLSKGDQITVTLEATDYRGTLEGKGATSDPMALHITDERGVLGAMMDSDERSARQLDAIIERQLGIGDSR